MSLDKCNETCGYVAAISASICLGSFGVPVKSEVVKRLDVDPLVVQVRRSDVHISIILMKNASYILLQIIIM